MKINTANLYKCVFDIKELPESSFPEFVFIGRSNVGKSTLINTLCNRDNLAKTSSTPGKTRSINYFIINDNLFFVDLPGYGFAKASKDEKNKWQILVENYFKVSKKIKMILLLIDIRHGVLESDKIMIEWINYFKLPFSIVLTKADKVSRNIQQNVLRISAEFLKDLPNLHSIIPFSSKTKTGIQDILAIPEL